jgi:CheY-like chemotaxis protein
VPRSTWAPGKRYRGRPAQLLQRSTASSSPLKHPTRPDNGQGTYRLKLTHYPDTLIHGQDARDRGRSCAHSRDTSDPGGSRPRGLKRRRRLPRRRYRAAAAPDAIVLDLMMPLMDGFAVLEAPRRDGRTTDVPVMVLSAIQPEGVRRGAMLPTGRQAVLPQNLPSSGPPAL